MKKNIKRRSKKGFTLLEVLLATAILVIVSSMLMQGFITTMGYSYNSSVYSRSASWNSKLCIAQMAEWSQKADQIKWDAGSSKFIDSAEPAYKAIASNEGNTKTISFSQAISGKKLTNLRVVIYNQKNVNVSASALDSGRFNAETLSDANKYADNRYILFYYPTYNGSGYYQGDTHIYMLDGEKCWGHKDSKGNDIFDRWVDPSFESEVTGYKETTENTAAAE